MAKEWMDVIWPASKAELRRRYWSDAWVSKPAYGVDDVPPAEQGTEGKGWTGGRGGGPGVPRDDCNPGLIRA